MELAYLFYEIGIFGMKLTLFFNKTVFFDENFH